MDASWNTDLWRQVGAAIDMLDNATYRNTRPN